jgi:hypothetical protein
MHSGAWRPRVKRRLRPHQPELVHLAELRIEPPAFTGTHGHSSQRNVHRRRRTAVARGFAHAGDIAMGIQSKAEPAAVSRHARDGVAIRLIRSTRF